MTQILVEALIHVCGALVCILAVYNAMRFQSSVILIGIPLSVGIMLQVRWSYSQQIVGPVLLLIDLALILGSLAVVLVVARQAGRVDELRSTVDIRGTAYALMAEEQPGMVCRFKPDGTLLYVNGAYARYFDLPPEKLVGTNFLRLVPESEHNNVLEHLREVSNGLSRPLAHEVITSDGKLRWVEWTDQPVFDHRGQLVEFQAMGFDVTDRRNANLLLMRSARQKAVVGELGQMSLGGIQTQELLERSMHEIAELCGVQYCGYFELQPDEDTLVLRAGAGWQPDYIGQLRMQLSENEQARYTINTQQTVVVHNPDKETRFAQCRMHYDPSMNCILSIRIASENRVHGLISLHSHEYGREFDIDDLHFIRSVASVIAHTLGRRTTEEELRLSESRFRTLVENMPILFCAFDENLNVVYWNKECERVTGISSELVNKNPMALSLVYPDLPDHETDERFNSRQDLKRESPETLDALETDEREILTPDGQRRIVAWSAGSHRFPIKSWSFWGVGIDVTDRKRMEREIIEASAREQRRIGHELHDNIGQLLTGVGFIIARLKSRLEQNGNPDGELARQALDLIKEIIDQTRFFARGLNPVNLNMEEGFHTALEELAVNVKQIYGVECEYVHGHRYPIKGEAALNLYRIAQEAVNNSIRHGQADWIRLTLEQDTERGRLSIEDNGCGLAQQLTHADRKSMGVPNSNGNGMGIQIMEYRAQVIGGKLSLLNRPEGGLKVSCVFSNQL